MIMSMMVMTSTDLSDAVQESRIVTEVEGNG